jgi:hypothetical protein
LYKIRTNEKESTATMATRTRKKNTKAAEAEAEDLDELEGLEELEDIEGEEPEDDEEVEEAPAPKRSRKTAAAKPARKRRAKKVVEEEPDDEEEDEDVEEEEPAPKKRTRSKSNAAKAGKPKSNGVAGRTTKEITGGVGSAELAEAASEAADAEITGRDVRVWLRKNEIEKDDASGRYTWPSESNKVFKQLAKRIAKDLGE